MNLKNAMIIEKEAKKVKDLYKSTAKKIIRKIYGKGVYDWNGIWLSHKYVKVSFYASLNDTIVAIQKTVAITTDQIEKYLWEIENDNREKH